MLAGNEDSQIGGEACGAEEMFLRRIGLVKKPNPKQGTGSLDGIRLVLSECAHNGLIRNAIGFGLAFGVLVDAFVVRMLLIPAVMHLLGRSAWWIPRWLDRILPHADFESSGRSGGDPPQPPSGDGRQADEPAPVPAGA